MCKPEDYRGLELLSYHHRRYVDPSDSNYELDMWHRDYLPKKLTGKWVLDGGAGCGETAFFFLAHGAAGVVCFEPDPAALRCLYRNFGEDPRVIIVPYPIDFIKLDIEGAEKDMVIETHFIPELKKLDTFHGTVTLWRLAKMEKLSRLMLWIHKKRIRVAHVIGQALDAI